MHGQGGFAKFSKYSPGMHMPVHAKEPAQKVRMQGLSLRCGQCTDPVIQDSHFTRKAQLGSTSASNRLQLQMLCRQVKQICAQCLSMSFKTLTICRAFKSC